MHAVKQSLRFTKPRKRVFDTVQRSSNPMKAYDIVEALGDVKPMTVYRALEFLSANGLVHRIESLNAYVACQEGHCHHQDSQYFICNDCGTIEEVHNHKINDVVSRALAKQGFHVTHTNFELRGLCAGCK